MTDANENVPYWPKVDAVVRPDGTGEVTINGTSHPVQAGDVASARAAVLELVRTQTAATMGRPVRVDTNDPSGRWHLLVHPDGTVSDAEQDDPPQPPPTPEQDTPASGAAAAEPPTARDDDPHPPTVPTDTPPAQALQPAEPSPPPAAGAQPAQTYQAAHRKPTLEDLLARRPAPATGPATQGWRATLRHGSGGLIKPAPGPDELRHREAVAAVQRSLDGPKTVVVVNPKGGAHKTTATLLLAATFGIHRGGYTLAWDNNETRGTLGWRANPARHTNTAVDLLRDLPRFTDAGTARVGDLDNYVRSQGSAQFDVLASDEDAASAASIDDQAFRRLHQALARFYRLMVIDTGNNMRSSNWQAAIEAADQLVIVSTVREDTAQSAAWLVDALRGAGKEHVVDQAVTVLSAPARKPDTDLRARLHDHFTQLTRTVIDVPHDPALVDGGPITYDALAPTTRTAWLHAAAAVADGL